MGCDSKVRGLMRLWKSIAAAALLVAVVPISARAEAWKCKVDRQHEGPRVTFEEFKKGKQGGGWLADVWRVEGNNLTFRDRAGKLERIPIVENTNQALVAMEPDTLPATFTLYIIDKKVNWIKMTMVSSVAAARDIISGHCTNL